MSLLGKAIILVILAALTATFIHSIILMYKIMKHKLTEEEIEQKTKNMRVLYITWFIIGYKIIDGTVYTWLLKL